MQIEIKSRTNLRHAEDYVSWCIVDNYSIQKSGDADTFEEAVADARAALQSLDGDSQILELFEDER